ncbi:MAG: (Fe-S)-binding protein [Candidatus Methanodesulfokora sp.]
MSWAGLPGYDCWICGAPSCSTAARLMEAGELSPESCPFSRPLLKKPWITEPTPISISHPCPSEPQTTEISLSLVQRGAKYRPIDMDLSMELLNLFAVKARSMAKGQIISADLGGSKVQIYASGRLMLRNESSSQGALEDLKKCLFYIMPAVVCQNDAYLFLEEIIYKRSMCQEHLMEIAGIKLNPDDVKSVIRGIEPENYENLLKEGVNRIKKFDETGLILISISIELRRVFNLNPPREMVDLLRESFSGNLPEKAIESSHISSRRIIRLSEAVAWVIRADASV